MNEFNIGDDVFVTDILAFGTISGYCFSKYKITLEKNKRSIYRSADKIVPGHFNTFDDVRHSHEFPGFFINGDELIRWIPCNNRYIQFPKALPGIPPHVNIYVTEQDYLNGTGASLSLIDNVYYYHDRMRKALSREDFEWLMSIFNSSNNDNIRWKPLHATGYELSVIGWNAQLPKQMVLCPSIPDYNYDTIHIIEI